MESNEPLSSDQSLALERFRQYQMEIRDQLHAVRVGLNLLRSDMEDPTRSDNQPGDQLDILQRIEEVVENLIARDDFEQSES